MDHPLYTKYVADKARTGRDPYITVADAAVLIRATLAKQFPAVKKFYVRSESFAGGAAVDVYYDGVVVDDEHGWPVRVLVDYDGNVLDPTPVVDPDLSAGGRYGHLPKDGMPPKRDVEAALAGFVGSGFDGSIDLGYYRDSWLNPDGTASFASTSGTEGSRGYVPAAVADAKHPNAIIVSFGSKYVSVHDELPWDVRSKAKAS